MSTFDIVFPVVFVVVLISAFATWLCIRSKINRLPEFPHKVNLPKQTPSKIEMAKSALKSDKNPNSREKTTSISFVEDGIEYKLTLIKDERQKNTANN